MSLQVKSVPTEGTVITACADCVCEAECVDSATLSTKSGDTPRAAVTQRFPDGKAHVLKTIDKMLDVIGHDVEILGNLKLQPSSPEKPTRFYGGVPIIQHTLVL